MAWLVSIYLHYILDFSDVTEMSLALFKRNSFVTSTLILYFQLFFIPVTALLFGIVPWQQLLRMFVGQLSVNCGLSHRNDFGAKRGKLF